MSKTWGSTRTALRSHQAKKKLCHDTLINKHMYVLLRTPSLDGLTTAVTTNSSRKYEGRVGEAV